MNIIQILIGLGVLTLGRQLFWLFVGGIGFMLGLTLASRFFPDQSDTLALIIALIIGLIGAVLAILLQRVAVGVAGFIAGGLIVVSVLGALGLEVGDIVWLPFLIGGIIGAILVIFLFDVALIGLSSLAGAALIVQTLDLDPLIGLALFVVLCIVGIGVQAYMLQRE
jgi:hypothetical protein